MILKGLKESVTIRLYLQKTAKCSITSIFDFRLCITVSKRIVPGYWTPECGIHHLLIFIASTRQ